MRFRDFCHQSWFKLATRVQAAIVTNILKEGCAKLIDIYIDDSIVSRFWEGADFFGIGS